MTRPLLVGILGVLLVLSSREENAGGIGGADAFQTSTSFALHRSVGDSRQAASMTLRRHSRNRQATSALRMSSSPKGGDLNGSSDLEAYKKEMAKMMVNSHEDRMKSIQQMKDDLTQSYDSSIQELKAQLDATGTAPKKPAVVAATAAAPPAAAAAKPLAAAAAPAAVEVPATPFIYPAYAPTRDVSNLVASGLAAPPKPKTHTQHVTNGGSGSSSTSTFYPAFSLAPALEGIGRPLSNSSRGKGGGGSKTVGLGHQSSSSSNPTPNGNVNAAYAARTDRPGWDERWGAEEKLRVEREASGPGLGAGAQGQAVVGLGGHVQEEDDGSDFAMLEQLREYTREYMVQAQTERTRLLREDESKRKEIETLKAELAQVRQGFMDYMQSSLAEKQKAIAAPTATATAPATPAAPAAVRAPPAVSGATGGSAAPTNAAYEARNTKPGWDVRWGKEEAARVEAEKAAKGKGGGAAASPNLNAKASSPVPNPTAAAAVASHAVAAPVAGGKPSSVMNSVVDSVVKQNDQEIAKLAAELDVLREFVREYMIKTANEKQQLVEAAKMEAKAQVKQLQSMINELKR